jgi:outer membrane protein assembly complex protein YaeT
VTTHVRALLALLVLLGVSAPAAAEIPPDLDGKEILAVEVAGETAAIAAAREIGIPLGAPLNRALVRNAIQRLLATGRWTNVQVDAVPIDVGVKLVVWLTPRVLVHRLHITGNPSLDEQTIRDALRIEPGAEVSADQLPELARSVAKLYAERGYVGAQIEIDLRDTDDPSRKVLMLAIEEGAPTRIRTIRFHGEQPLDPVPVLAAMESEPGDVLDRRTLEEDAGRAEAYLRERGYLEAELGAPLATITGERAFIAIPTRIGPRYSVVLSGYAPFSRSEIYETLGLEAETLTEAMLAGPLQARVVDFYARHGYHGTLVHVERGPGSKPGTAVLRVRIERGEQLRVVAWSFAGARHFSRDFLRDQLFSYLAEELPGSTIAAPVDSEVADSLQHGEPRRRRAVPAPPITDPEQFYYEPAYGKAIEHIAELYRGEGYLSVRVGPPELARIGKDRAAVLIPVVEGPRTRLHEVVISGASAIPPREVLLAAGLQRDQPFSYLGLEQARRRVLDAYHERGHVFAKVSPNVRFSRDRTRAELELQIVEAFPVYVDQIVIEGAPRTSESLIRRVMRLEPGDVYRPSLARESERELASLGIFTGVSVAIQDPELPARVKSVVVTVSERRNQFIDFGAGISTGQGARGGFEYGYRNLFGQAVGITLRVQLAYQIFFVDDEVEERFRQLEVGERLERRISLGTTIPRLPGFGRVRTSVDLVHLRDNERDFGLDQNAVGLTFTHSPVQYLTLTLGGDLETNEVQLFAGEALEDFLRRSTTTTHQRRLLRVPDGASTLVAARTSASYDRRDNAFTPTSGYFLSSGIELARTLAVEREDMADEFISQFLKVSVTGSGYLPIGRGVVLAGQARAGRIFHLDLDSQTYPNRAFYLGGVDTMRGYLEDELIPQDRAEAIIMDPTVAPAVVNSGDAFVLFRGEIRFPLYAELSGGLFTDVGNLWADGRDLDALELRPTAGFGLRLNTPVGPIALDWGFNLDPREALDERSNALHFSIGLF